MADTVSRSWFAVFPNPEQHGYTGTPEQIVEKLKEEWISGNVFCQALFPEKSVKIPCFRRGTVTHPFA